MPSQRGASPHQRKGEGGKGGQKQAKPWFLFWSPGPAVPEPLLDILVTRTKKWLLPV